MCCQCSRMHCLQVKRRFSWHFSNWSWVSHLHLVLSTLLSCILTENVGIIGTSFFTGQMPLLLLSQQCQSTEENVTRLSVTNIIDLCLSLASCDQDLPVSAVMWSSSTCLIHHIYEGRSLNQLANGMYYESNNACLAKKFVDGWVSVVDKDWAVETVIFTGSIAHSASWWYLVYSEANFEVFCQAGATHCTDGVKFGMEEGLTPCQISPLSVQRQRCRTPKSEIFTQIWPRCGI